jgi:small conductance mechanosensitive channel
MIRSPDALGAMMIKLQGWGRAFVLMLPNLLVALLVAALFWLLSRLAHRVARAALDRFSHNRQINGLIASLLSFVVLGAGLFIALGVLELDKTVTTLLAGAGILGLALGFAFQDIASNFIAGVLISLRHPFRLGDLLETNGFFGTVQSIHLRSTELLRPEGQVVLIPNKLVFEKPIVNYSLFGKRRIDLRVGVSYGDDLGEVKRIVIAAVEGVEPRDLSCPVELFFEEFGDSSVDLVVRFWIEFHRQGQYLQAKSDAIERIEAAFNAAGLTFPFPTRTLDLPAGSRSEIVIRHREDAEKVPGE